MDISQAIGVILKNKDVEFYSGNNVLVWESESLGILVKSGGDYPTLHSPFQQPFVDMLWERRSECV